MSAELAALIEWVEAFPVLKERIERSGILEEPGREGLAFLVRELDADRERFLGHLSTVWALIAMYEDRPNRDVVDLNFRDLARQEAHVVTAVSEIRDAILCSLPISIRFGGAS